MSISSLPQCALLPLLAYFALIYCHCTRSLHILFFSSLSSIATPSPPFQKSSSVWREWSRTSKLLLCCRTYLQHGQRCQEKKLNNETTYQSKAFVSSTSAQYVYCKDWPSIYTSTCRTISTHWDDWVLVSLQRNVCLSVIKKSVQNINSCNKNLITWINEVKLKYNLI